MATQPAQEIFLYVPNASRMIYLDYMSLAHFLFNRGFSGTMEMWDVNGRRREREVGSIFLNFCTGESQCPIGATHVLGEIIALPAPCIPSVCQDQAVVVAKILPPPECVPKDVVGQEEVNQWMEAQLSVVAQLPVTQEEFHGPLDLEGSSHDLVLEQHERTLSDDSRTQPSSFVLESDDLIVIVPNREMDNDFDSAIPDSEFIARKADSFRLFYNRTSEIHAIWERWGDCYRHVDSSFSSWSDVLVSCPTEKIAIFTGILILIDFWDSHDSVFRFSLADFDQYFELEVLADSIRVKLKNTGWEAISGGGSRVQQMIDVASQIDDTVKGIVNGLVARVSRDDKKCCGFCRKRFRRLFLVEQKYKCLPPNKKCAKCYRASFEQTGGFHVQAVSDLVRIQLPHIFDYMARTGGVMEYYGDDLVIDKSFGEYFMMYLETYVSQRREGMLSAVDFYRTEFWKIADQRFLPDSDCCATTWWTYCVHLEPVDFVGTSRCIVCDENLGESHYDVDQDQYPHGERICRICALEHGNTRSRCVGCGNNVPVIDEWCRGCMVSHRGRYFGAPGNVGRVVCRYCGATPCLEQEGLVMGARWFICQRCEEVQLHRWI